MPYPALAPTVKAGVNSPFKSRISAKTEGSIMKPVSNF